jgi:hypothetical protein
VCLLLQDLVQSCLHGGGGGYGRTCATRDDEPRPVWTSLVCVYYCRTCVCLLLQDLDLVLQYLLQSRSLAQLPVLPITMMFRRLLLLLCPPRYRLVMCELSPIFHVSASVFIAVPSSVLTRYPSILPPSGCSNGCRAGAAHTAAGVGDTGDGGHCRALTTREELPSAAISGACKRRPSASLGRPE